MEGVVSAGGGGLGGVVAAGGGGAGGVVATAGGEVGGAVSDADCVDAIVIGEEAVCLLKNVPELGGCGRCG